MAHEIECKVALTEQQVPEIERRIRTVLGSVEPLPLKKQDTYFSLDGETAEFRLRQSFSSLVVTRKIKRHRDDGIEVNKEIEFTVPIGEEESVETFVRSLGYRELIRKEKTGFVWSERDLTLELVYVHNLGWYLEIELLVYEDGNERLINRAVERLAEMRNSLGVANLPLEPRYYIDILREQIR